MNELVDLNGDANIYFIRGVAVMLDKDLAVALGVDTGNLNQNAKQSPKWEMLRDRDVEEKYRFKLTSEEKSKILILAGGHNPWVYTQLGCAHFGTSLLSHEACELAIKLSENFIESKSKKIVEENKSESLGFKFKEASLIAENSLNIGRLLGASESLSRAHAANKINTFYPEVEAKALLSQNIAAIQYPLLTPTEIGLPYGLSALKINKQLEEEGLQIKEGKNWIPTNKSLQEKLCELLDVGKKHSNGTPVQQIKWYKNRVESYLK